MALETAFAPSERAPQEKIRCQHETLAGLPWVRDFLDAVPTLSMVLNQQRQIVFANRAFTEFLGLKGSGATFDGAYAEMLGRRPGEAVGCIRSHLTAGGCGTTPFCRTCGAVISILNSQQRHALDIQECRLVCGEAGGTETPMDLRVWSRPIDVAGEVFTVFSVVDISHEKRRQALERIFFHDVINTAGCVKGLAELLAETEKPGPEIREMAGMISESAGQLLEEISAQQMLSAAESGDLKPVVESLQSLEFLARIIRLCQSHESARGKDIILGATAGNFDFHSDPVLLRRVLVNLVKNALEAVAPGETVTLGSKIVGDTVCFTVHNAAVMPPDVQLQIFSRSFSTKGAGRGLGTYSIKLISERYLHGRVSFVSSPGEGTRFTVRFPRIPPAALKAG